LRLRAMQLGLEAGTASRPYRFDQMCNLYSITTNQAAIVALFRVMNRYVGNLPPMPGVFPDYPAPVVRNAGSDPPSAKSIQFRTG
jgi:putative SOS response-associated peptidase YedK